MLPSSRALSLLFVAFATAACSNARAPDERPEAPAYPGGPYALTKGKVAPDLELDGVDEDGQPAVVHLHDYFTPEARSAQLLLVEVDGGLWCGTCRWFGAHAAEIANHGGDRVRRLEVIVGNRDNAPATPSDAARWQSEFALVDTAVAVDPAFSLGAVLEGERATLPLFVMLDTRTMRIVDSLSNPAPADLGFRIDSDLAELDGVAPPDAPGSDLVDGFFERNEWDLLAETTLPGAPPADETNGVADLPAARALGEKLYFDAGLSPSGTVSCATCHDPEKHLSDGLARGQGVGTGDRRTPAIGLSAHARWQFWDGRADSLWAQALGPLECPLEYDSSRVFVARRLIDGYATELAEVFPGQPLPDASRWPAAGKPGEAAFDDLSEGDREAVTRLFVDAGKAIAAYERTFRVAPNALDAYLAGELDALGPVEKYGLQVFVRSGCMQCHWGPRLTDDAFHDTRISSGGGAADRGRIDGFEIWQSSEFRADGRWSDAQETVPSSETSDAMLGQFKTPPLRGVADLDHWGHGGVFDDLAGVTESYGKGGVPAGDTTSAGTRDPWIPYFGETAEWALVPFLATLHAEPLPSR